MIVLDSMCTNQIGLNEYNDGRWKRKKLQKHQQQYLGSWGEGNAGSSVLFFRSEAESVDKERRDTCLGMFEGAAKHKWYRQWTGYICVCGQGAERHLREDLRERGKTKRHKKATRDICDGRGSSIKTSAKYIKPDQTVLQFLILMQELCSASEKSVGAHIVERRSMSLEQKKVEMILQLHRRKIFYKMEKYKNGSAW